MLLGTIDGEDTVELSNRREKLENGHRFIETISGTVVRADPFIDMWLIDPHDCGLDCCSQESHRQIPTPMAAAGNEVTHHPENIKLKVRTHCRTTLRLSKGCGCAHELGANSQ